jgi:hypothetical protein
MKRIPLYRGRGRKRHVCAYTQVDDQDYSWLSTYEWHLLVSKSKNTVKQYAAFTDHSGAKPVTIRMHRLILDLTGRENEGDHADGDGLNNQRHNLRQANHSENQANKKMFGTVSRYTGLRKRGSRWKTYIVIKSKPTYLGSFPGTPEGEVLAAKAYDEAAKRVHGKFAKLNFPQS